ncbi:MAG: glycine cleavage system protein GcvH [Planctomycetota bacterium]|jgi:glycine cleavage system H protein
MSRPDNARYSASHEWAVLEGDLVTLGVTDFAVEALGDIVFIDLPEAGHDISKGETACEIESVKAVGEVYCPVTGTIEEVNTGLGDDPSGLAGDPFGGGWLVKIRATDTSGLDAMMDLAAYETHLETAESE